MKAHTSLRKRSESARRTSHVPSPASIAEMREPSMIVSIFSRNQQLGTYSKWQQRGKNPLHWEQSNRDAAAVYASSLSCADHRVGVPNRTAVSRPVGDVLF